MSDKTQDASHEVNTEVVKSDAVQLEVINVREGAFGAHGTGDTSGFGGLTQPVIMPGAAQKPYGGWYDEVADQLATLTLPDAIEKIVVHNGEITFFIRRHALLETVKHLRNDPQLRFEFCSSVSGVHFPHETDRELHVVIHLM